MRNAKLLRTLYLKLRVIRWADVPVPRLYEGWLYFLETSLTCAVKTRLGDPVVLGARLSTHVDMLQAMFIEAYYIVELPLYRCRGHSLATLC